MLLPPLTRVGHASISRLCGIVPVTGDTRDAAFSYHAVGDAPSCYTCFNT